MEQVIDVLQILRNDRAALEGLGVRRLGVFGSYARGEAQPDSDVDVLVELDEHTFDRYMDLKLHLEDLLGKQIDLVLADGIKARLRDRILSEVVYAA